MKFKLTVLLFAVGVAGGADSQNKLGFWSRGQLQAFEKPLHEKVSGPRHNASIDLADYGASATAIARREGNGVGEAHAQIDDYFIVQSGEAILVTGGAIANAKETAPGETRGDSIEGGERRKLVTGDIVHIPAQLPHQLLVGDGKSFTYFIVKVKVEPR
ncbi:MAG TPA: hypothetical protein VET48_15275 [Steroidobacteraceae bacterium]|nr:hypothetical protein [Steroidobacteraceae bacterium]